MKLIFRKLPFVGLRKLSPTYEKGVGWAEHLSRHSPERSQRAKEDAKPNIKKTLMLLALILVTSILHINVAADSAVRIHSPDGAIIDLTTQTTTYRGAVQIESEKLLITGDTVTTQMNPNNEFAEIIAIGQPATYLLIDNETNNPTEAEADLIKLYPKLSRMYLIGNANLNNDNRTLNSTFIDYDLEKQNIHSRADNFRQGRIIIRRDDT